MRWNIFARIFCARYRLNCRQKHGSFKNKRKIAASDRIHRQLTTHTLLQVCNWIGTVLLVRFNLFLLTVVTYYVTRKRICALFSKHVVSFWDPHRGSASGPHWGTSVPKPLICPPLEKILWAPSLMKYRVGRKPFTLLLTCTATCWRTLN